MASLDWGRVQVSCHHICIEWLLPKLGADRTSFAIHFAHVHLECAICCRRARSLAAPPSTLSFRTVGVFHGQSLSLTKMAVWWMRRQAL